MALEAVNISIKSLGTVLLLCAIKLYQIFCKTKINSQTEKCDKIFLSFSIVVFLFYSYLSSYDDCTNLL